MTESRGRQPIFYSSNIVNLCIDSWKREGPCGRLYHQYTADAIPFLSLYEALESMNQLYDVLRYPETFTAFRSFASSQKPERHKTTETGRIAELPERKKTRIDSRERESLAQVMRNRGQSATFLIHVRYRQHFSWQGEIIWVDGQQRKYFRSVWELIRLIDSARKPETKIR